MAEHKGAIKIDTKLNNKKIEGDFKELEAKTKRMINQYNKSIDSIKGQELALEKVKQKLDDINSGKKMLPETKELHSELEKINKELAEYELKANEISNKQLNLTNENIELKKQPELLIDYDIVNQNEQEILNLDNEMQLLAEKEEQAKQKAKELSDKISELRNNSPEIQNLTTQYELMSSKLAESKKQHKELGESIKENLNQKANLLGIQNGVDGVGKKIDKLKNKLTRMFTTVMLFSLVRKGLTSLRNKFSELLKTNDEYSNSLNQIKANLMTAFAPIYNACLPAINSLMSALSKLTGTIAVFISGLFGKSLKQSKKEAEALSKSLKKTADSGEDVSNSLSSIDEIQNVDDDKSSGGASGDSGIDYSGELQYSQKLLDILNKIKKWIGDNKDSILVLIAGIVGGLLAIKLGLSGIQALGIGITVAGIAMAIKGIIDFIKDPSWENFKKILEGISIALLGIAILVGGELAITLVGVAILIAGIVTIVDGIINYLKDPTWENFKIILAGIVLVVTAVAILFGGIPALIVAIIAAVAALGIAIYKNWNNIKTGFKSFINFIIGGINTLIGGINKLGITLPSWIPLVGGKRIGFSIPKIPKLATGDVIPPNSEFMAILGDQKRGVNIETPLSTMLEAFNKALDSRDGGITTDLLLEIIQLLNNLSNKETVMTVDGNRFAQLMTKYFDRERNRLNQSTVIKVM